MGKSKAFEMLVGGTKLYADEALRINFVAQVFSVGELETTILPKLERLAESPMGAILSTTMLLRKSERNILRDVCDDELNQLDERIRSEEGIKCLLDFCKNVAKK